MHKHTNTFHSYSSQSHGSQEGSARKRTWTDTVQSLSREAFTSPTEPTVPISSNPLDIFSLFFTEELLNIIVVHTNTYASQTMTDCQAETFTEITAVELKAYIGFCILMGMVRLPSIDDYWKRNPIFRYEPIASKITRDRFREIRRYLHFVNYESLPAPGTPGSDRVGKIRPVLEYVVEKCQSLYQPDRDIVVDEAMIQFQGWSSLKQYLPMKPVKRGIKVWVLATSKGYFCNMQVWIIV